MEANHPHLTTQKSFYVEISRARDRAELVTDDAKALREQLEAVTGERISALEGIGEAAREPTAKEMDAEPDRTSSPTMVPAGKTEPHKSDAAEAQRERESPVREKPVEMDVGL